MPETYWERRRRIDSEQQTLKVEISKKSVKSEVSENNQINERRLNTHGPKSDRKCPCTV